MSEAGWRGVEENKQMEFDAEHADQEVIGAKVIRGGSAAFVLNRARTCTYVRTYA